MVHLEALPVAVQKADHLEGHLEEALEDQVVSYSEKLQLKSNTDMDNSQADAVPVDRQESDRHTAVVDTMVVDRHSHTQLVLVHHEVYCQSDCSRSQ